MCLPRALFFAEKNITQTKDKVDKNSGGSALTFVMVNKWLTEFHSGCSKRMTLNILDALSRSLYPKQLLKFTVLCWLIRNPKNAKSWSHIHITWLGSFDFELSSGYKKAILSSRWLPRMLKIDYKQNRKTTSKTCLMLFNRNPDEFLRRFVTLCEKYSALYRSTINNFQWKKSKFYPFHFQINTLFT